MYFIVLWWRCQATDGRHPKLPRCLDVLIAQPVNFVRVERSTLPPRDSFIFVQYCTILIILIVLMSINENMTRGASVSEHMAISRTSASEYMRTVHVQISQVQISNEFKANLHRYSYVNNEKLLQ